MFNQQFFLDKMIHGYMILVTWMTEFMKQVEKLVVNHCFNLLFS